MLRYLALVWDARERVQNETAYLALARAQAGRPDWHITLKLDGMIVLCAGVRPGSTEAVALHESRGVILGTLFERIADDADTSVPGRAVLGAAESARIVQGAGRPLIDSYWGRYVAFLNDPLTRRKWVVRDPMGYLPCYTTATRGVQIFFSFLEDCTRLRLCNFTVNFDLLAAQVVAGGAQNGATALNEISEIHVGECMEIRPESTTRSFYWHPFAIATDGIIEDANAAAPAMRRVGRASVQAWASRYPGILHKLSGGFDSAVVLGCLKDAPSAPRVVCINYYSSGADTDERPFARAAASHAGYELLELHRDPDVAFEQILRTAISVKPFLYVGFLEVSRSESELAREHGLSACFSGGGGDQIFYQSPAMPVAADYVHRHGIRTSLLRMALDLGPLATSSVWRILGNAARDGLFKPRWDPLRDIDKHRRLARQEIVEEVRRSELLHPWFRSEIRVPLGKLYQIYMLSVPQDFYDPYARPDDHELVEPLLASQPLVELCLRIPTYVLMSHGRDRALARQAFAEEVPQQILQRRTKGGIEEHIKQILMKNLAVARELLLDGCLVKEGLLDRQRVEAALSGGPTRAVAGVAEIFDHLSTEAWLRIWTQTRQQAVAA